MLTRWTVQRRQLWWMGTLTCKPQDFDSSRRVIERNVGRCVPCMQFLIYRYLFKKSLLIGSLLDDWPAATKMVRLMIVVVATMVYLASIYHSIYKYSLFYTSIHPYLHWYITYNTYITDCTLHTSHTLITQVKYLQTLRILHMLHTRHVSQILTYVTYRTHLTCVISLTCVTCITYITYIIYIACMACTACIACITCITCSTYLHTYVPTCLPT